MTHPSERRRHQTSAAPHAPSHDPLTPGLPLGQGSPFPNIEGGGQAFNYTHGDPIMINIGLILVVAFVVFLFSPRASGRSTRWRPPRRRWAV